MVLALDPKTGRFVREAERKKEIEESGKPITPLPTVTKPPTAHSITHILKNPEDEFKPSSKIHIPEANRIYVTGIDRLLKTDPAKQPEPLKPPPPPEKAKEEERERREREKREAEGLLRRVEEAGKEAAKNFEDFLRGAASFLTMVNPFARLGSMIASKIVEDKAKQENLSPEAKQVIEEYGRIAYKPETVLLESAPRASNHIRDVINGVRHVWFGGGDPVDLARERAAVSAMGNS